GQWTGTNRLWLTPGEPVRESSTEMTVALVAQGKFATFQYTWADDGKPQDGLLLLEHDPQSGEASATWVDSWHMQDNAMFFQGKANEQGVLSLKGSYAAPPGRDWGWQINIVPNPDGTFKIAMLNISPDGRANLAVEATYTRKS